LIQREANGYAIGGLAGGEDKVIKKELYFRMIFGELLLNALKNYLKINHVI
jgi:hypothetical protein